jgi:hypothetical protein
LCGLGGKLLISQLGAFSPELNSLRKKPLNEGHGFHGTPGQVSRAVQKHSYEGFSP